MSKDVTGLLLLKIWRILFDMLFWAQFVRAWRSNQHNFKSPWFYKNHKYKLSFPQLLPRFRPINHSEVKHKWGEKWKSERQARSRRIQVLCIAVCSCQKGSCETEVEKSYYYFHFFFPISTAFPMALHTCQHKDNSKCFCYILVG